MKVTSTQPVPAVDNDVCVLEFVLDETGSMQHIHRPTVNGFNAFLTEQRSLDGRCLLSLSKFDTSGIKTPYVDLDMAMVPNMTNAMFVPGGLTNLRDAIGERITNLEQRLAQWTVRPRVLFFVMTDGDDNASTRYAESDIAGLIAAHPDWSFHYYGSTESALATASRLGFPKNNSRYFDAENIEDAMREVSATSVAYRANA